MTLKISKCEDPEVILYQILSFAKDFKPVVITVTEEGIEIYEVRD